MMNLVNRKKNFNVAQSKKICYKTNVKNLRDHVQYASYVTNSKYFSNGAGNKVIQLRQGFLR